MHGWRQFLLLALWAMAGCSPAPSPPDDDTRLLSEVIARGPGCASCSLEFEYLGQLGGPDDTILLSRATMIVAREDGAFIAAPGSQDDDAAVFDSLGATPRPFGRRGDGPGENGRILNVLPWLGDSVVLAGFSRLTILGGERGEGRTIRVMEVSASPSSVALPAEGIIVRNFVHPPYREFVAFNNEGSIRAEIGPPRPPGAAGDVYESSGQLGYAQRPHAFWSAPLRYRIQMDLWDARDGSHLKQFQDTVSWFTPHDSADMIQFLLAGNDMANPPPPAILGLRESSDSVLWLLYNVAARDWAFTDDGSPPLRRHPRREAYDGVLDLRDPATGQVLVTTWINLPFAQIVNDTLLADRWETEEGFWVLDIYKVRLQR